MPIDFSLTDEQKTLVKGARQFATQVLPAARKAYLTCNTPEERYKATKPFYEIAVNAGLLKACVPAPLGGTATSLVDGMLVTEEFYAVEPSMGINILTNGLGLSPIIIGGNPEQQKRFLAPFLTGQGAPTCSLVYSEVGGSANWLNPNGKGVQTTATRDGDEWVINGEKVWATSSAGWDFKGADVNCVVCRTDLSLPPTESIAVIVVTRADIDRNAPGAFTVVNSMETVGHKATSGPHIKYTNLRVPVANMLGTPGRKAIDNVERAFTESAAFVGAMAVGIMRCAFETALNFAKTEDRNGPHPIIDHQSVADLLLSIKGKLEASRYLVWKAAHMLQTTGDRELCYHAKIFCSEIAMDAVVEATRLVGIQSYSTAMPFGRLLEDCMVLAIFDGGNVGVRRRQLQKIFSEKGYDPLATLGAN